MDESVTVSFVGTVELKHLLEQWAREEDRTISATLRQILVQEAQRRQYNSRRSEVMHYQPN